MNARTLVAMVTKEEYEIVKANATEAKMSVCAYVRTLLGFVPAVGNRYQKKPHPYHRRKDEGD